MQRRNFLKSLLSAGVMLSPISIVIENLPLPGGSKEITSDAAFDRMPYSILIKNVSDRIVEEVDILGSSQYINDSGFAGLNKLVVGGAEISSMTEGKTYLDILYNFMINPMRIDKMVIERSEKIHPFDLIRIISWDPTGIKITIPFRPATYISPYDTIDTCVCFEQSFMVDAMTKVSFEQLKPDETIAVRLYPNKDVASVKQELPDYLKNRAELLCSTN